MEKQFREYINRINPLREEVLSKLIECFKVKDLKKNQFFVKEGEYATQIGFLNSGIVRAYFLSTDGKEYNKQFFTGPSIIGAYTSLLTKRPNKIAQQALTDCELWVANYADIESLYDRFHDFERFGRKMAEYYFLEKEQKEIEMALLDATKRYQILRDNFPRIEAYVAQYHIASYLGISPTQLSRIRATLSSK